MTLKIEVTVPQDIIEAQGAGLYLGHALSAIGYKRIAEGTTLYGAECEASDEEREASDEEREASDEMSKRACEDEAREAAKERMAEQVQEVVAKRKRRTKAEIEADNAAAAAQAQQEQPNISTGAERIDPANPEDVAQDAADEAAEAEKVKAAAGGKLTHDDLRKAVSRYQVAFGMAEAIAKVPQILGCAISEVPEADLASAIAKIDAAVSASKAETVAAPAREFTKQTVVAALKAYGAKYDGETNDTTKMPSTMEDCPRIFEELFGAGAVSVSKIPQTPEAFEKATLAIEAAVESNRFGRTAVAK